MSTPFFGSEFHEMDHKHINECGSRRITPQLCSSTRPARAFSEVGTLLSSPRVHW